MRKLSAADVELVMECLGYFSVDPGSYLSSGKVTGPKGMVFGTIEEDEYITAYELRVFLVEVVQLLEDDVKSCISALPD